MLPVLDHDDHQIGVLTIDDILEAATAPERRLRRHRTHQDPKQSGSARHEVGLRLFLVAAKVLASPGTHDPWRPVRCTPTFAGGWPDIPTAMEQRTREVAIELSRSPCGLVSAVGRRIINGAINQALQDLILGLQVRLNLQSLMQDGLGVLVSVFGTLI